MEGNNLAEMIIECVAAQEPGVRKFPLGSLSTFSFNTTLCQRVLLGFHLPPLAFIPLFTPFHKVFYPPRLPNPIGFLSAEGL